MSMRVEWVVMVLSVAGETGLLGAICRCWQHGFAPKVRKLQQLGELLCRAIEWFVVGRVEGSPVLAYEQLKGGWMHLIGSAISCDFLAR
jgi:hypothetical protein